MDILDDHSRALVAARVDTGPTAKVTWDAFTCAVKEWGLSLTEDYFDWVPSELGEALLAQLFVEVTIGGGHGVISGDFLVAGLEVWLFVLGSSSCLTPVVVGEAHDEG